MQIIGGRPKLKSKMLMQAKDVKAYVKRNKNDAADAEAICEAVRRPTMRFVRVKSAEQQGRLMQLRGTEPHPHLGTRGSVRY
jgi:transposase